MGREISTLLFCADVQAISAIRCASRSYEITCETCFTAADAFQMIKRQKFSMLILDFDLPGAADVLRCHTENRHEHPRVVIALSSKAWSVKAGGEIHLLVHKPCTDSLMERNLRSAYGILLHETRAAFRHAVEIGASASFIQRGRRLTLQNTVLRDLSSTGLRLKTDSLLLKDSTVFIDFQLPGTHDQVHAVGRIIWTKPQGEAGVQFLSVPAPEFQRLKEWLAARCPWTTELPLRSAQAGRYAQARSVQ